MKSYEQFQYERLDESIVGKAAGIVNRAMSGAKRIGAGTKNMLSKTTTAAANQLKPKTPQRKPLPKPKPTVKSAVRTGANMVKNVASNLRGKTYEGGGLTKQFTNKSGISQAVKQGISDTNLTTQKGLRVKKTTVGDKLKKIFNPKPDLDRARVIGQKFKRKFAAQDAEKAAKAKEAAKVSIKTPKDDDNASGSKVTTGRDPKTPSNNSGAQEKPPSRNIDKKTPADTKVNVSGKSRATDRNPDLLRRMQMGAAGEDSNTSSTEVAPRKPIKNRVSPDSPTAQAERMPNKYDRLDAKTGERVYTGPGRPKGSQNKKTKKVITKVADAAKNVASNVGNAAKDKAKEVAGNVGNAAKNVASDVGNAAKNKAKEVVSNVGNAAKNKTKELVDSGKKKRDASRKSTKVKVTTNYTEPKKGEEMKAPEKKGKVTVNTSKDTANASERIIQAMDKQGKKDETNPVQQAKQDSKKPTALTGSTLDRTRSALKKTLNLGSGSSSTGKKNTQLKDMDDDTLARQSQDSDTGKFRRNASSSKTTKNKKYIPPSKTKSQNIQTQSVINQSRKKNQSGKKYSKGGDAMSGGGNQEENKNPITKKFTNTNKNKNNKNKQTNESFSHWREQFLWEVDKKYPDKVKEIKPMSGKNTITINPEDESSKYKRGY